MIDDEKAKEPSYFFCRTLDVKRCAAYTGPKTPGAVWFAQNATEGPSYVDVLVIAEDGDYIASLRIWICKEEDGTYVFADIDDNNIVLTGTTSDCAFSDEEKKRLETLANSVANDIEQTHIGKISPAEDYTLDDMIIEWRAQSQSLYFYEFAPKEGVQKNTGYYVDIGMPILAVTVRGYNGSMSLTLYFQVLQYPSDTKAGTYHYIGRDYYNYSSAVVLHQQTAPGALEE